MKKLLLFTAVIAGSAALNAQTITKDDLKFTIGNTWPSKENAVAISALDTTSGTGKNWDFSSYTTGADDTVKVLTSGTSDLMVTSNMLGDIHYKSLTGNYSLAGIGIYNTDDPSTGHMGLPHTQGGSWISGATAFVTIPINIAGSVVASGTVTIPYGTYNAVLVKEAITGAIAQTTYYWETVEHGRVAAYALEKGKLLVMQSTNFTVGTKDIEAGNGLSVFPNPASDVVNITGASSGAVKVFNTLGTVVNEVAYNGSTTSIDVSGLSKGLYFVQLTTSNGVSTQSVVVE